MGAGAWAEGSSGGKNGAVSARVRYALGMAPAIDPKSVSRAALAAFARRHGVLFLAVFGSAARGELKATSDVDVMMDLTVDSHAGLFEQVRMASELEALFGRRVDLVTRASLKPRVRATVEREAFVLYEA